jgi:hypothetical protein
MIRPRALPGACPLAAPHRATMQGPLLAGGRAPRRAMPWLRSCAPLEPASCARAYRARAPATAAGATLSLPHGRLPRPQPSGRSRAPSGLVSRRGRTTAPRGDAPGRETPGPRPPRPSRPERICLCAPPGTAHRAVEAGGRRGRTARAWQAGPRPRAPGQEPPRPGPCSRTEAASLAGAALPVCSCEPMGLTTEPRPRLAGVGRGARADGAGGRRAAGCRTRDAGAPPPRLGLETSRAELGSARCGSVSK